MDGLWATKSEGVGLNAVRLVSQISNLCDHKFTNVTDGQTDDMRSQDRDLHCTVHRTYGKNWAVLGYAQTPSSQILMGFSSDGSYKCTCQI